MIVVAEGPSAAGKSTWTSLFAAKHVVPETGRLDAPASMSETPHSAFWNGLNCARWQQAIETEAATGLAVCDTDPLKLHYDYCLASIGLSSWSRFDNGISEAAAAIRDRRLGISDLVVVHVPDDATLARQRVADQTRRRRNFDKHRRLAEPLRDWYLVLDRLDPGRVQWGFSDEVPPIQHRDRFDLDLFRAWMTSLPRH